MSQKSFLYREKTSKINMQLMKKIFKTTKMLSKINWKLLFKLYNRNGKWEKNKTENLILKYYSTNHFLL